MTLWQELTDSGSIEEAMSAFGSFQDTFLVEVHYCAPVTSQGPRFGVDRNEDSLRMYFQGGRGAVSSLELLCIGNISFKVSESPFWTPSEQIDDAWILKESNRLLWTTNNPKWDEESTQVSGLSVSSKRMFWREVNEWKGTKLRYLDPSLEIVQGVDIST